MSPLPYLISLVLCTAGLLTYRKIAKLYKRRKNAELAEAVVHEQEVAEGKYGAYRYYLHYSFEVATYTISGKAEVSAALFEKNPVGSTVTVIYETHNPAVNYLQAVFLERLSAYWAMCIVLAVSAVVVPWVF